MFSSYLCKASFFVPFCTLEGSTGDPVSSKDLKQSMTEFAGLLFFFFVITFPLYFKEKEEEKQFL